MCQGRHGICTWSRCLIGMYLGWAMLLGSGGFRQKGFSHRKPEKAVGLSST